MEHKQVAIVANGANIFCDEGIADIILLLNKWKIFTDNSCEDNNGKVWISFESYQDAELLAQLCLKRQLTSHAKNGLFEFLIEEAQFKLDFNEEVIFNGEGDERVHGTGAVQCSVSLRFDKAHLPKFRQDLFDVFQNLDA